MCHDTRAIRGEMDLTRGWSQRQGCRSGKAGGPMDEDRPPQSRDGSHNAGAFLGPNGTFPAALHTLSDEMAPEPTELEIESRGPETYRPSRSLLEVLMALVRGTPR